MLNTQKAEYEWNNKRKPISGPVLFPPGPESDSSETSGVIVGASGFGFVPPNSGKAIIGNPPAGRSWLGKNQHQRYNAESAFCK